MNHTQGPWKPLPENDYIPAQVWADGMVIADVYGQSRETRKDNAQLMAASPDLLALAKHILALETDPYLQGHPEWEAFLNEAKAAENKAEGTISARPKQG